jgi:hypothetical protein
MNAYCLKFVLFCFSVFQVIALEARVVGYESDVIKFQQQVEEKEAILVTLKQEVSVL